MNFNIKVSHMNATRLSGLIAATYTPFDQEGSLLLSAIPSLVEHLLASGVSGLYVCGSTGEGMSLSNDERKAVSDAYIRAVDKRVPVIVQVGHNSLRDACELAQHAQQGGADIVSATCPSYYSISDVSTVLDCMAQIAGAASKLPFYYYHIPALTGSKLDIVGFLEEGVERIPNMLGLKYTDTKLFEFQLCREVDQGRFDVVWGCDEMLLGALATGAQAAIGSTYNVAAPLYLSLMQAMNVGDLTEAGRLQLLSVKMIRTMSQFPFHAAMKAVLEMLGHEVGPCRLPQGKLSDEDANLLRASLIDIGFFDWCGLPLCDVEHFEKV